MLSPEKLARLNALARKAKSTDSLTNDEEKERAELRAEYLGNVRAHVADTLDRVRIVEQDGSLTPLIKKDKPLN